MLVRAGSSPAGLLAVLAGLLFTASASSQEYNFEHYGLQQGLPQTQVLALHQDDLGYLWAGTYGGLARFNGREFIVFSAEQGLNSNSIGAITNDAAGRVWVGTTNGLCRLPVDADVFRCFQEGALAGANVQALQADGDVLWVGTSSGLYALREGDNDFAVALTTSEGVNVTALAKDAEGRILVGTYDGLLRVAGNRAVPVGLPSSADGVLAILPGDSRTLIGTATGLYELADGRARRFAALPEGIEAINALARGHDGTVWAASNGGVVRIAGGQAKLLTTRNGLMADINFSLLVDREGIVWLGNDDGLTKHVPGAFFGYTRQHGLLHYFVRTINEDHRGRLWLGTREGVQIVPKRDGDWRLDEASTITPEDGLVDARIYSIAFPAEGEALLATGAGVVHWRDGEGILRIHTRDEGLPVNATQALKVDGERTWVGTNVGVAVIEEGRARLAPDPLLATAYVYRIIEDASGRLWFGTRDHGLLMFEDNEVRRFTAAHGLTGDTIWDLAADAEGGVWVASNGDGLFHVRHDGSITRYSQRDGLADNFVWQVLQDNDGNVWSYTNHGISRFDGEQFENFGSEDGLLHLEGGATGAWQSHDGQLWFASADGLMRYDPVHAYVNNVPPPVVVERVRLAGMELEDGAELPYRAGSLEIQYAALSYQSEAELRYQYRLRGADEAWSEPVRYRPITYANLGGGEYTFEVRARNPDGVWSHTPASIAFRILPPFWTTTWFRAGALLLLAFLAWSLFRMRLRNMEARRHALEVLVGERTRELEAANRKLQSASVTDPLTGLHNRRFLVNQIDTDVAQSRRAYTGPSVFPNRDIIFMMIDLDNFKEINDTHGHGAGDRVLRQYAQLLGQLIRESDYVVRWGGEEFLIVARQAESSHCNVIAERIIRAVRDTEFVIDDAGTVVKCTCSMGVSHFPFHHDDPDFLAWEQIVDIADVGVYLAKASGRDGWISIRGADRIDLDDGTALMQAVRYELPALVEAGQVEISGSHENIPAVAVTAWRRWRQY